MFYTGSALISVWTDLPVWFYISLKRINNWELSSQTEVPDYIILTE